MNWPAAPGGWGSRRLETGEEKGSTLFLDMRIYSAHISWRLWMLSFENSPKKATNLSLNTGLLEAARQLGLNLSQTVNSLLANEVKRRYWERWNEDNREAISAYNDRIANHGLTLAKYRSWGQSLGDGRENI
jgi:antitoxin CcdA